VSCCSRLSSCVSSVAISSRMPVSASVANVQRRFAVGSAQTFRHSCSTASRATVNCRRSTRSEWYSFSNRESRISSPHRDAAPLTIAATLCMFGTRDRLSGVRKHPWRPRWCASSRRSSYHWRGCSRRPRSCPARPVRATYRYRLPSTCARSRAPSSMLPIPVSSPSIESILCSSTGRRESWPKVSVALRATSR